MKAYYENDGIVVYHGDAREILSTMANGSIDMIFTDPPYGHNNNNNGDLIHRWELALGVSKECATDRAIENDGDTADELVRWLFKDSERLLGPGCCCCCCCCCGGGGPDPQFARWSLWMDEHLDFKQMVVWDKGPMGMGWHYRRSYETILVGQRRGAACRWFDTTDRVENIIRSIAKIIPQSTDHPTSKPIALAQKFIGLHAKPGDLVLDPFCGGGSTLLAARRMDCRAIGIDIDERWCEMAARRLSQLELSFE